MDLPSSSSCGPLLLPGVVATPVTDGARRINQRCYQLAGGDRAQPGAARARTEILDFIADAANSIVGPQRAVDGSAGEHVPMGGETAGFAGGCDLDRSEGEHAPTEGKTWTVATETIYADIVNLEVYCSRPPIRCPSAGEGACNVIQRGTRRTKLYIADDGCYRLQGHIYSCSVHSCR